jgi:FkbM family methyltransferase
VITNSLVSSLKNLYKKYRDQKLNIRREVYNQLITKLVSDPVVYVEEFEGNFLIDKSSHLFGLIVVHGCYESQLAEKCCRYIDPNKDAIDIGANVGFYSVLFAKKIAHDSKVLSIEPTKSTFDKLTFNLRENGVGDKVIAFNGAVSDTLGKIEINVIPGKEEYSSLNPINHFAVEGQKYVSYEVECLTIDLLVEKYKLAPGFIKCDVEGAENLVLLGSKQVLKEHRPIILVEVSDPSLRQNGSSAKTVIDFITSNGYKVVDAEYPERKPGNFNYANVLCIPE